MRDINSERYKINRPNDNEDIWPEETLMDSLNAHSAVEAPISNKVFGLFAGIVIFSFAFFVFKAFDLQVINGKKFYSLARAANRLNFPLSPLRGMVLDSGGSPFVRNVPVFNLVAIRPYLPKSEGELADEIKRVAAALGREEREIRDIFEDQKNHALFVIVGNLDKDAALRIKGLPLRGVYVVADSRRDYIYGPAASHLVGYVSKVTSEELKANPDLSINEKIGRTGLEFQYDEILKGSPRFFDPQETSQQEKSEAGDIFLYASKDIQLKLYETMSEVFRSAGVRRGAAIVQNPKTGAVLGLVSMPSFDNNLFEKPKEDADNESLLRILSHSDRPILNRVIGGRYSPGSTIKPLLALAGLREGVVTPSTIVYADGAINIQSDVDPSVFFTFRDWKFHGWTDIKKAIADSVDIYFYALGGGYRDIDGLGIDRISSYFKTFNVDRPTGIDLPGETEGFVPTREWKEKERGEGWYKGDTYNISIGQGDLLVTPVWINTYIGAIANGGKILQPLIAEKVKDADGKIIHSFGPRVNGEIPFDKEILDIVRQGMRQTVVSGTAKLLGGLPVPVAAKTGTAQVSGRGLNSLFTVFGPYDDPEITITVLVENINDSQGLAIRVANDFLGWYFGEFESEGAGD